MRSAADEATAKWIYGSKLGPSIEMYRYVWIWRDRETVWIATMLDVGLLKWDFDSIKCNAMDFKPCFKFHAVVPVFSFQDAMPWMIHHQRTPELLAKASHRDLKKKRPVRREEIITMNSDLFLTSFSKHFAALARTHYASDACYTWHWFGVDHPDPSIHTQVKGWTPWCHAWEKPRDFCFVCGVSPISKFSPIREQSLFCCFGGFGWYILDLPYLPYLPSNSGKMKVFIGIPC